MPKNKRTIPHLKPVAVCACLALVSLVLYLSGEPSSQGTTNQTNPSPNRTPDERLLYHNNIGIALLEQFSFREALAEFAECLKVDAKFVPALVNSGLAHFYLQEFSPAEGFFKKAVALNSSQPNALFALGMIYRNQNQMDLALESFQKIRTSDPQDATTLYQAGQIYLKKQDYAQAVSTLQKVVELSPYDIAAHYNLATALIRKGDQTEGQRVMETFTRLREKGGISSTGTQYGEQGKYMLAIGEYPDIKGLGKQPDAISAKPVRFVDVTDEAGIQFQHGADPNSDTDPSAAGSGAAFCDFDGDGHLDLYLSNAVSSGARGKLYRNSGKGSFEDVTQKAGIAFSGVGLGAYWGDFNNDRHPDLFLTNVGPNVLYRNNGDGTFSDVTSQAEVGGGTHIHSSAAAVDYDHDGDLDLFVGNGVVMERKAESGSTPVLLNNGTCHLFRNNGNESFTDVAEEARIKVPAEVITSAVFSDFDNRRDVDFWAVAAQPEGNHLYSNQRIGTFRDVLPGLPSIASLKKVGSVSAADFDKDGWMDFVLTQLQGDSLVIVKNLGGGKFETGRPFTPAPPSDLRWPWMAQPFDYDNDGDIDLFQVNGAARPGSSPELGPELWENQGDGRFVNVTEKAGLDKLRGKPYRSATIGDYDDDGDTDVLLTVAGGKPVLLRNEGGNQNNWIKIRVQGTNSNKSGIGTKVEVKSGALWQKVEISGGSGYLSQSPPEVIFGLGKHKSVEALRLLWPGGVLQSEINLPINQTKLVQELDRKGTSCPLLYTWNGEKYQFVTDFLGGCAIGYLLAPGQYNTPDTDEYVKISGSLLRPNDGQYSLRINNQLEEVLYIDQTELVVLDHPAGMELFPNERLMPAPPFPEFRVFAAQEARPPKAAWDHRGRDVLPLLTKVDRNSPDGFVLLPYKGYAEEHELILDLGDLTPSPQVQLLMTAWIDYADSTANFKASQVGAKLVPPYLQVRDAQGHWQTVISSMGFPAGLPKTMVVDLTGKFLSADTCVRIVTSMRIYWDQILVNTLSGSPHYRLYRLSPSRADLRYAGFPREFSPDGKKPLIYDYDWIDPAAPWKSHTGSYTRFGDVTPLLRSKDDQYVIMRNGDEIQIDFSAERLPVPPNGWTRTFLLYADGFGKDMDIHSSTPDTVTPLPFHAMSRYPYPETEHYPDTEAHRRYQHHYNTRHVPETYSRLQSDNE
jgi:tetratricopeptide (TPR) repeat protein